MALGDICTFNYGKSLPAGSRSGDGYPVYGSNGEVGQHEAALTKGPTIVVGRKGSFGEIHFSDEPCWPIDTTYFIDEDSTTADLRWLMYRLRTLGLTRLNRAAAIPGLNRNDAYRQRFLFPPLEEQRRTAAILDHADALRGGRTTSLALVGSLEESIFLELFGDGSKWASDSRSMSLGEMEDYGLVELGRGKVISRKDIDATPGDLPIYSSAALNNGEFGRYGRYMFNEEMITWSVDGGGHFFYRQKHKFSVTNVGGWIRVLDEKRLRTRFLHSALAHLHSRLKFDWTQKAHSSVIKRVYRHVLVPSLDAQIDFCARAERCDSTCRAVGAHRRKLETLFASLQHRAFIGQL